MSPPAPGLIEIRSGRSAKAVALLLSFAAVSTGKISPFSVRKRVAS